MELLTSDENVMNKDLARRHEEEETNRGSGADVKEALSVHTRSRTNEFREQISLPTRVIIRVTSEDWPCRYIDAQCFIKGILLEGFMILSTYLIDYLKLEYTGYKSASISRGKQPAKWLHGDK